MTDDPHSPTTAAPTPEDVGDGWGQPSGASSWADGGGALDEPRPEVLVGAAFAGGLIAALIIKRLGRRDY